MIYLSAGHYNQDPGAVANGYKEADLTKDLRGLIIANLIAMKAKYITDEDSESLGQYIRRIKPGTGSVLCELHFNASANAKATGAECLYGRNAGAYSKELAKEISDTIADDLSIANRGAKSEAHSARGRLGILHTKAGIAVLPEICFISNKTDMANYQKNKIQLAHNIAQLLVKYDKLLT